MANTCKVRFGKGTGDTMCGAPCGNHHYCRVHRQQNAAHQRRYRANARARTSMIRLSWDGEDAIRHTTVARSAASWTEALEMAYELRTELVDGIGDGTEMEDGDG